MTTLSRYRDLFRNTTIEDKLGLFNALLDAREDFTSDLALALLRPIHRELGSHRNLDRQAYKHYAITIESLRYQMADVLQQVVAAWNFHQNAMPPEWFSENK